LKLVETVTFSELTGLVVVGYEGNPIEVTVNPGEEVLVRLEPEGEDAFQIGYRFSSNMKIIPV
jgi:hypothetical protein